MRGGAILSELLTTRWIVTSIAGGTLLYRRDVSTALCLAGAVLNALLSKVLKRLLKSPRPSGAPLADPGMPSSHAQSLFYLGTYLTLALLTVPDYSSSSKATASLAIGLGVRCSCHSTPAPPLPPAALRSRAAPHDDRECTMRRQPMCQPLCVGGWGSSAPGARRAAHICADQRGRPHWQRLRGSVVSPGAACARTGDGPV